jgi:hypothetical protein
MNDANAPDVQVTDLNDALDKRVIYEAALATVQAEEGKDPDVCLLLTFDVPKDGIDEDGNPTDEGWTRSIAGVVKLKDISWVPSGQIALIPKSAVENPNVIWAISKELQQGEK